MAAPANAAVRESRRRSTPSDVERLNVIKALTAAEYSRRQFILNFAAIRNTGLLIPGRKSDAVKAAEQWAARHLRQAGSHAPSNDLFKYTVDERLWSTHVGNDIAFPFTFMRPQSAACDDPAPDSPVKFGDDKTLDNEEASIQTESLKTSASAPLLAGMLLSEPATTQDDRQPSTKRQPKIPAGTDFKRSLSLSSVDDLKVAKLAPEKFPFLVRLGRSWSRRLSSAT